MIRLVSDMVPACLPAPRVKRVPPAYWRGAGWAPLALACALLPACLAAAPPPVDRVAYCHEELGMLADAEARLAKERAEVEPARAQWLSATPAVAAQLRLDYEDERGDADRADASLARTRELVLKCYALADGLNADNARRDAASDRAALAAGLLAGAAAVNAANAAQPSRSVTCINMGMITSCQ